MKLQQFQPATSPILISPFTESKLANLLAENASLSLMLELEQEVQWRVTQVFQA